MKNVPVVLVTGFLGSGKTTFLNWLIEEHPDIKVSLILNEFGDVGLESQFIKKHSGEIAELSNGCMCCVAKSDIPRVVRFILDKSPETEYLLIEASGLSDPDPIRDAFRNPDLNDRIHLMSTICIVDALNFEKTRDEHSIIMSQIGDADIIILSKVQEAGEEQTNRIKAFIESIGVGTTVVLWNESMHPDIFLKSRNEREERSLGNHKHEHEQYDEVWFKTNNSVDSAKFSEVMRYLPKNIIRSKGFINASGVKMMVQYVPGNFDMFLGDWKGTSPNTAVLFLGREIDEKELLDSLRACEM